MALKYKVGDKVLCGDLHFSYRCTVTGYNKKKKMYELEKSGGGKIMSPIKLISPDTIEHPK